MSKKSSADNFGDATETSEVSLASLTAQITEFVQEGTPISRPESRVKEVRRKQLRQFTATSARHPHSCKH